MTAWQLTAAAEADLRAIVRYTRNEWGSDKAQSYAGDLKQAIQRLADNPNRHRAMPQLHADVRIARGGQHLIFALLKANGPALILAILHERMDLIARLANRLP